VHSISSRLLIGTGIVLAIFVVLTALAVSWSVHQRAETARQDRLQGLIYGILGATELTQGATLQVNEAELPDQRLTQATVGLYAELIGHDGRRLWQSRSSAVFIPQTVKTPIGEWLFERVDHPERPTVHRLQLQSAWALDGGNELPFIVQVVDEADVLAGQLRKFDRTLWASLLGVAVAMLAVQLLVLRHSLKPLDTIGAEMRAIESGQRDALSETVPKELAPLTGSINALLGAERNRHAQYRHLLDDLAHSLKTPLSVLRNLTVQTNTDPVLQNTLAEQTQHMQNTVERYLQRATIRSPRYLAQVISPQAALQRITASLGKLYKQPQVTFTINVPDEFRLRIDEADLYEILGNILDNACKYGATQVEVSAIDARQLLIDDNGPGFPPGKADGLLGRGVRADSATSGSGTGLTASRELLQSYGGDLQLGVSPAHGGRVVLSFA